MAKRPKSDRRRSEVPLWLQLGCAQLFVIVLALGGLFVVNSLVVSFAYHTWLEVRSIRRQDPRLAQTILIIGPLLLLFVQYWLYDQLRNWLKPREGES